MSPERHPAAEALPAYDVGEELGRGTWGIVFSGRQRQLGRPVAIKQLMPGADADPELSERFLDRARILAALDHPHVASVLDFVEHEGSRFLVTERLTGGSVRSRARERGLTPRGSCALILATCTALQRAHGQGVLHRDLRPENLMFSADDMLRVADLGIVEIVCGPATLMTRDGDILGTPAYMAPEQLVGEDASPATDVYAAAAILYEMLSGERPFPDVEETESDGERGDGDADTEEEARPLADAAPAMARAITAVVDRALNPDPAERYESAEAYAGELKRAADLAWGPGWETATGVAIRDGGKSEARPLPGLRPLARLRRPLRLPTEETVRARRPAPEPEASAVGLAPDELIPVGARARQRMPAWVIVALIAVIVVPAIIAEVLRRL